MSSLSEHIAQLGVSDNEASQTRLASYDLHLLLSDKKAGLPHVDAIAVIDPRGKLINISRSWPISDIDLTDRDYFQALKADATLETFVSRPVQDRLTGLWIIHLARRLNGANGNFIGLLVGAVTLEHFETFFQSISLQDGAAIALVRRDGMLLTRYPRSDQVGRVIPMAAKMSREKATTARQVESPVDGQLRIVSAMPLASYPLVLFVSQTEEGALRSWRTFADSSTSMALARTFFVLLVAWAASRWWRRQRGLTHELRSQNLRFDTALNNMSQGLCLFDGSQQLIVCNSRYLEMYDLDPKRIRPGITLREIVDLRFEVGSFPAMSREKYLAWRDSIATSDKPSDSIVGLRNGRIFEIHHRPMPDGGWVATHEDISERQKLNARLEQNVNLLSERTALLQAIIDNFPGGIGFFDRDLRVMLCNDRAKAILDLPERFFSDGPPLLVDILRFNALRGEYGPGDVEEQVASKLALAEDRRPYHFERERPNGTVLDVRGIPIDNGGFITTYMDITERYRSEAKIAHMARHDALTGLANRVLLNERLEYALTHFSPGESLAVHLLDLDRFKAVNDTLGHLAGDKLLRLVADRLRPLLRETDIVARMGGDEFAIVQVALATPSDAASLARRVIEAVSRPFEIDGNKVVIGACVGIAMAPEDGQCPEVLMKNADLSLYQAKANSRGSFCFFEPEMDARMQARHAMEIDLRNALAAGEFELYYQPMVDLHSNEIRGFEALVRWHHPANGTMSPDTFIPLAEETGLIIALGEWTIRQACATAAKWPGAFRVAVNLSPAQFKDAGLPSLLVGALAASGLAPERLELEINETARHPLSTTRTGCAYRNGRLRHRPFFAQLSAELPL
jgi:diguanylate cyclase (GGDEF)-like protein